MQTKICTDTLSARRSVLTC